MMPQIWEMFAQVDASASRQHHGTGLGLAIARKFVELHDGRVAVCTVAPTWSEARSLAVFRRI